ncbi:MAG: ABC transporter ATP-binding protein [Alphaproteobacteria bacterium]|nr:ABC transporter ATP-binding protein [Alphaproteobacteria bacterium]
MSNDTIIDVKSVSKEFGGLRAVSDCSLSVKRGSITGLIGPNGAGKTTLFNLVAGALVPDSGEIIFGGEDIAGLRPHALFAKGILRTFQIAHEFSHMTALENLMVVPSGQPGENLATNWFRPGAVAGIEHDVRIKALDVIEFLKLGHVRDELAGNLSGGQKKLLELGRTMMVDASLVLLDEVAAGVNRTLLKDLAANIVRMNKELGYTFFVIEHDMDLIGELCDPVIVMAEGAVIAEGTMDEIRANPAIVEAYFGTPVEVG